MSELTSSPLFDLIHCMSMTEKKHFKLYSRYHSRNMNEMNYLRLFDIIAKQKKYDEEEIVRRGIVKKERLRAVKHYLHHLILESLRVLSGKGENIDNKLNNMLHNARLMRDKGMQKEEMKFTEKAKELALRHERWGALLEILLTQSGKAIIASDLKARQGLIGETGMLLVKLRNL